MSAKTVGEDKVRCVAFRPQGEKAWCYVDDVPSIGDYLADADVGDMFELKIVTLTRAEIAAMPEFTGW